MSADPLDQDISEFFPIPCDGAGEKHIKRFQKQLAEARNRHVQSRIKKPSTEEDVVTLTADILTNGLTENKYQAFVAFGGTLFEWYKNAEVLVPSVHQPELSIKLAAFTDFCFSILYAWNAIHLKGRSPIVCPTCKNKLFVFTNYCPNHPCEQGQFPTIESTYQKWNQTYEMKPEEDVVGDMGGGIALCLLEQIVQEGFLIVKEPSSPNRVVQADYAIVETTQSEPLVLLVESKFHPAIYLPAYVHSGDDKSEFMVPLDNSRPTIKSLIRNYIRYGFDNFYRLWKGLHKDDSAYFRVQGLKAGVGHKIDDSKNQPGIERTDDFKKALAQAMMFSLFRPSCKGFSIYSGIFSNVYPKGERGLLLERLSKQHLAVNTERWPIVSAIIGLTQNVYTEPKVKKLFR